MRSFVWTSFTSLGLLVAGTATIDHSGEHSLPVRTIKRRLLSKRSKTRNHATHEGPETPSNGRFGSGKGSRGADNAGWGPGKAAGTSGSKGEGKGGSLKGGSKSLKGGSKSRKGGSKDLKGGSKSGKGERTIGKGGSKGRDSGCSETVFYYKSDEFRSAFQGEGLLATNGQVAIFNEEGRKIGTYSESTVVVGQRNCNSNGVYSFDFTGGVPSSQIFTSQTCCGVDSQSVIGGTGLFQCTTGFVEILKLRSSPHRTYRRVVVCDATNGQCLN